MSELLHQLVQRSAAAHPSLTAVVYKDQALDYRSLWDQVSQKALGYGMARDRFFVEDVMQVRERMSEAIAQVRSRCEPMLVEVRTYRFRGHSMSDPAKYRTAAELEEHKKKDALLRSRLALEALGETQALAAIDAEIEEIVADAVKFAEESPEPGPELLEPTTYTGPFAR